jgi:hypothetical protein
MQPSLPAQGADSLALAGQAGVVLPSQVHTPPSSPLGHAHSHPPSDESPSPSVDGASCAPPSCAVAAVECEPPHPLAARATNAAQPSRRAVREAVVRGSKGFTASRLPLSAAR